MLGLVLTAGGASSRFGGDRPKVLQALGGVSVLRRALEPFLEWVPPAQVVVTAPLAYLSAFAEVVPGAQVVPGGETRQLSVLAGLEALPEDVEHVLVHDAARPLTSAALIARVLHATRAVGAALPLLPATDSLHRFRGDLDDPLEARVTEPLDRIEVGGAQTPQGARRDLLRVALRGAVQGRRPFTDEASALHWLGHPVCAVRGEVRNIKITFPEDLLAAERMLERAS